MARSTPCGQFLCRRYPPGEPIGNYACYLHAVLLQHQIVGISVNSDIGQPYEVVVDTGLLEKQRVTVIGMLLRLTSSRAGSFCRMHDTRSGASGFSCFTKVSSDGSDTCGTKASGTFPMPHTLSTGPTLK